MATDICKKLSAAIITVIFMFVVVAAVFAQTGTRGTFTDPRDNRTYRTVVMPDGKTWMAENLNYDTADGTRSWCYGDDKKNCVRYGRLYNWFTAMAGARSSNTNPSRVQGVCPAGWHLPSDAEWTALMEVVGVESTAGRELKSMSGWYDNGNGTDEYGFSALPGGYRFPGGSFYGAGYYGFWWTAVEGGASSAWGRFVDYLNEDVDSGTIYKTYGFSVRCVAAGD